MDGQILHNHSHLQKLVKGRLLVVDSGAESSLHYAGTSPGPFGRGEISARQRVLYDLVLTANVNAIKASSPA